jgi:serine phosphatase RsbU (regulator of sigma subunit)
MTMTQQIVQIIAGVGGLGAAIYAFAFLIRTWQTRKIVNADAAARLTQIGGEMLEDVRRDAAEQIAAARADAASAIERALSDVRRARSDAEEARAEAAEARKAANAARREAEEAREAANESNRRYARFAAELFRPADPATSIERLKALIVRNGSSDVDS